jgi:hypothetical protein
MFELFQIKKKSDAFVNFIEKRMFLYQMSLWYLAIFPRKKYRDVI